MDISAPHIILPEDFTDKNTSLVSLPPTPLLSVSHMDDCECVFVQVVLDLGHVTFGNVSDWSTEELVLEVERHLSGGDEEDDDGKLPLSAIAALYWIFWRLHIAWRASFCFSSKNLIKSSKLEHSFVQTEHYFATHIFHIPLDDLFQTPPSSPPSEEEEMTDSAPVTGPHPSDHLPQAFQSAVSLRQRQMDPYERYLLRLSDLQVLVGKAGDGWKDAVKSGHSSLHLLDKFTLSFQIQRYRYALMSPAFKFSSNTRVYKCCMY